MPPFERKKKMKFSPEITLGHLIQVIVITLGIIAGYASFLSRMNIMEYRLSRTDALLEEMSKAVNVLKENNVRLTVIQEQNSAKK